MKAFKCDRCGAFFMPHEVKNEDVHFEVIDYTNGGSRTTNLCLKCCRALDDFMTMTVTPASDSQ